MAEPLFKADYDLAFKLVSNRENVWPPKKQPAKKPAPISKETENKISTD